MTLDRGFLLLNILLILLCAMTSAVAAGQYGYLAGAVLLCAYVWYRAVQGRPLLFGDGIVTLLCFAAFIIMALRGATTGGRGGIAALDVRVPPVGDFLITFLCLNLCRRKTPREYFWMYIVSVVLMVTAGMLMPGLAYAFFFLLYALLGIATLGAFHIWCEAQSHPAEAAEIRLRARSLLVLLPLTLALMLPVALIFALLPRRTGAVPLTAPLIYLNVRPVVGFSPTVTLGQIGTIQDNPQRVMRVVVRDPATEAPVRVDELLLRGTGLETYEKDGSRWVWRKPDSPRELSEQLVSGDYVSQTYRSTFPGFFAPGYERVRCDITAEPIGIRLLFAPFAAEQVSLPGRRRLFINNLTHDLVIGGSPAAGQMQYSVVSRIFPGGPPAGDAPDADPSLLTPFLQLPPELSPRVIELARQVAPDDKCPTDYLKAQAILRFLSDSNQFAYTLDMQPAPGAEPVEDFLFRRRMGHCEYFASAMTILLRAAGVPARLVNGFKMYEWNDIGAYYVVRQSHAHSWAEAYIRGAGWRTYDPSVMRDAATPEPAFARRWGRNLYDAAERLWVNYVLNYDSSSQEEMYAQFTRVVNALRGLTVVAIMLAGGASLSMSVRQVMRLLRWALSPLAEPLQFLMTALVVALIVIAAQRLLRRWRRRQAASGARVFYARMERILSRRGLRRASAQTPWEFHDAVARTGQAEMAPVQLITERFCVARYGGRALTREELQEIERALKELRGRRRR